MKFWLYSRNFYFDLKILSLIFRNFHFNNESSTLISKFRLYSWDFNHEISSLFSKWKKKKGFRNIFSVFLWPEFFSVLSTLLAAWGKKSWRWSAGRRWCHRKPTPTHPDHCLFTNTTWQETRGAGGWLALPGGILNRPPAAEMCPLINLIWGLKDYGEWIVQLVGSFRRGRGVWWGGGHDWKRSHGGASEAFSLIKLYL